MCQASFLQIYPIARALGSHRRLGAPSCRFALSDRRCYNVPMEIENVFQNQLNSEASLDRLWSTLAEAGYSKTRPRQLVVDILARAEGSLSPAQIVGRAHAQQAQLGLVTVYRTLDILCVLGLARRIHLDGGCHSYALAERPHSHHLICRECQQVVEFDCSNLDGLIERVRQQTGYEIQEHWIELFGLCPRCKEQATMHSDALREGLL